MTQKKKLTLLGKSLMPEVLPAPARTGRQSPRERVRARLQEIAARTAALAAAATLSANCDNPATDQLAQPDTAGARGSSGRGGPISSGTSGYGVVDPLPPPATTTLQPPVSPNGGAGGVEGPAAAAAASGGSAGQSGASAGHAGTAAGSGGSAANGGRGGASGINPPWLNAGYGVVDPMPNPAVCPDPAMFEVTLTSARWQDNSVIAVFDSPIGAPRFITDAKTSAPVSVTVSMGNTLTLTSSAGWPWRVDVDVSIECSTITGVATVHKTLRFDTSRPANSGMVSYQVLKT